MSATGPTPGADDVLQRYEASVQPGSPLQVLDARLALARATGCPFSPDDDHVRTCLRALATLQGVLLALTDRAATGKDGDTVEVEQVVSVLRLSLAPVFTAPAAGTRSDR